MNICKGDVVLVIRGNDKGKKGKVLGVLQEKERIIVEGVRMVKHHVRPSAKDPQGGIIEREAPLHVSNVMIICPTTDLPTRIRKKQLENGKFVRISARSGEMLGARG